MTIACRMANPDDLDAAARLDRHRTREDVRDRIEKGLVALACQDDRAIGYARLEAFWPTMPYLGLIWVVPDRRGDGVGRGLLAFLRCELAARGFTRLLSSSQTNEEAPQRWHRRAGFAECGTLRALNENGVGETFFVMDLT